MAEFLGSPKVQYFNTSTGQPMSGGLLYSYNTGTTNARATYPSLADAAAATNANTNPVVLDSRGEATVVVSGPTDFKLTDSLGNLIWTVGPVGDTSGGDVYDSNGNLLIHYVGSSGAINYITVTNSATGVKPSIAAAGGDSNIGLTVSSKGTGTVALTGPVTTSGTLGVTGVLTASAGVSTTTVTASSTITATGAATAAYLVSGGLRSTSNVSVLGSLAGASAVNYFNMTSGNTGVDPILSSTGSDSNINIAITPKGSGVVKLSGVSYPTSGGTSGQVLMSNGSSVFAPTTLPYANQSSMQTGSSSTDLVAPGTQQFHQSACKAWCVSVGGSTTISNSYNITSVTNLGTGNIRVNFNTDFSSANFCPMVSTDRDAASTRLNSCITTTNVGYVEALAFNSVPTTLDPVTWYIAAFGTQ